MIDTNPFAAMTQVVSPLAMQIYIILMVIAVVAGTLFDVSHKGSAKFFAQRREKARAAAESRIDGAARFTLAVRTVAEAAVSGEFCKWPRRASHLLMMYGFLLHVISECRDGLRVSDGRDSTRPSFPRYGRWARSWSSSAACGSSSS